MVQAATIENRPPKGASIAVPQTNLKAFATANRLKGYRLDECDDPEIVGRFGHLFEWSPSIWGVCLEGAGTLALENRKRMGLAAGMDLWQECDFGESILLFDPGDRQMSRVAVKMAGIRLKRLPAPSTIEALKRMGKRFRFQKRDVTAMTGAATEQGCANAHG